MPWIHRIGFLLDPFGITGITWYRYNGMTLQLWSQQIWSMPPTCRLTQSFTMLYDFYIIVDPGALQVPFQPWILSPQSQRPTRKGWSAVDTVDMDQAAATLSSPRTPRHPMNFGGNMTSDYVNDGERKAMSKYPVDKWTRQGDRSEVDVEFLSAWLFMGSTNYALTIKMWE